MNVIPLILAAGAGYVGYKVFLDKKQPAEAPKANPALGQVDRLEQGKSYTVIHATKRKELGDAAQALGLTPPEPYITANPPLWSGMAQF